MVGEDTRVTVTVASRKRTLGKSDRTGVVAPSLRKATVPSNTQTWARIWATNERRGVAGAGEVLAMVLMCLKNKSVELKTNNDARKRVRESIGHHVDRVQDMANKHSRAEIVSDRSQPEVSLGGRGYVNSCLCDSINHLFCMTTSFSFARRTEQILMYACYVYSPFLRFSIPEMTLEEVIISPSLMSARRSAPSTTYPKHG